MDKDVSVERRERERERELLRSNSERDRSTNSHPRELAREYNNDQRDVTVAKYSCRGEVNKITLSACRQYDFSSWIFTFPFPPPSSRTYLSLPGGDLNLPRWHAWESAFSLGQGVRANPRLHRLRLHHARASREHSAAMRPRQARAESAAADRGQHGTAPELGLRRGHVRR